MAIDDTQPADTSPSPPSGRAARLSLSNYDLGTVIGSGGMGDVVTAFDKTIGRDVAIKQLRSDAPNADVVARFLREARIQARLQHPAIVPVHQLGNDERGLPFFTMTKLAGKTLLSVMQEGQRTRLLRIFVDVCEAIMYAHSRGVVHRDLKPANVMVGDFGEVYVLDWGLARMTGDGDVPSGTSSDVASLDGQTQAGAMLGTPGYMPPEQIEDASAVGPPADVYALGAILFEILAGEPAHPRGPGAVTSALRGEFTSPAQRRPDVPPELDALCRAAMTHDATKRPTVKQLVDGIQGFLDGDRDLEARKELAKKFLGFARDAFESKDVARRAEAMHAAGRALVLDPESVEAAAIVSTLIFTPAREHPAQLANELADNDLAIQKRQGRAAIASFVVVLAFIVTAVTNGVTNWAFIGGFVAYLAAHAAFVWRVTQRRASTNVMLVVAVGNALLAALISRTFGSMIIVPAVTCIMALSLTAYPSLIDRTWTVIGLLVTSWLVPVILEAAGVLAPTWMVSGDHVVLGSSVLTMGGNHTAAILIGSNILTIIVFGLFSSALAQSRRNAMRQAEVQAWHLRQLLPTTRALVGS